MLHSSIIRLAVFAAVLTAPFQGYGDEAASPFERYESATKELNIGDLMPDVPLRGDDGRIVRLRDFRGKALAVTFFYSRCSEAKFCPLIGRKFDTVQTLLARLEESERCHLLSVSLDPEHDTPEMLSAYARGYAADGKLWTFATGAEGDLRKLGDTVGLEYKRVGERIDHNLRTVVLDGSGRIRRVFRGDEWTPQELVADLRTTARKYR
jgi:protein SCO1/2